jgi:hypothetical protein
MLVVMPPDGIAGSAYREIGKERSRTLVIRISAPPWMRDGYYGA